MSRQIYKCPKHGEFEIRIPHWMKVQKMVHCLHNIPCSYKDCGGEVCEFCRPCDKISSWVPSVPNFIGGPTTGAKKE